MAVKSFKGLTPGGNKHSRKALRRKQNTKF